MSFLDAEKQVIIAEGELNLCAECGGINQDINEPITHMAGCLASPSSAPRQAPARTSDPNVYVWTDRGLERVIDVEKRRRQRR